MELIVWAIGFPIAWVLYYAIKAYMVRITNYDVRCVYQDWLKSKKLFNIVYIFFFIFFLFIQIYKLLGFIG